MISPKFASVAESISRLPRPPLTRRRWSPPASLLVPGPKPPATTSHPVESRRPQGRAPAALSPGSRGAPIASGRASLAPNSLAARSASPRAAATQANPSRFSGAVTLATISRCTQCEDPVKPDVVLFGEFLPERAMADAESLAARADLMLCVGSSLEVYPVAGLPSITLGRGGRLAVITKGPTPFDQDATVRMEGDVVADLGAVLVAL